MSKEARTEVGAGREAGRGPKLSAEPHGDCAGKVVPAYHGLAYF